MSICNVGQVWNCWLGGLSNGTSFRILDGFGRHKFIFKLKIQLARAATGFGEHGLPRQATHMHVTLDARNDATRHVG